METYYLSQEGFAALSSRLTKTHVLASELVEELKLASEDPYLTCDDPQGIVSGLEVREALRRLLEKAEELREASSLR